MRKRLCVRDDSDSNITPAAAQSTQPLSPPPVDFEPPAPDPEPTDPLPSTFGRGQRTKRPTWKVIESRRPAYRRSSAQDTPAADLPAPPPPEFDVVDTRADRHGLFCRYLHAVSDSNPTQYTPTPIHFIEPASSVPSTLRAFLSQKYKNDISDPLALNGCSNLSSKIVMEWHSASATKSLDDTNTLVHTVIRHALLNPADLATFDAHREAHAIDKYLSKQGDSWIETSVHIDVPDGKPHSSPGGEPAPRFTVDGLMYRPLVEIIRAVWGSPESSSFQYIPFRQFWKPRPDSPEEQVYGELYTSEAFNTAYEDLQRQPPEPGCTLERVVCAMMMYSDSTHLANFGNASLWPLYMFFGNQSKYIRVCPSSGSCHHVAYIPKLADTFHDWYLSLTGEGPPAELLTHCRRELMHAVLQIVLDDSFVEAYKHGIVLTCGDGITRRVFPRILTYSADYPEKALLATIRNLGRCPCPRCLLPKARIQDIGTSHDFSRRKNLVRVYGDPLRYSLKQSRKAIYEKGLSVKSSVVEGMLGDQSYVPTKNAFDVRLGNLIKLFWLFVVDLLHEIELGVWKALFTHLIRILVAIGGNSIQVLNERYRNIPTFGRSTIRPFHENASAQKKLAARDYEDLLQCSVAVFEGLFPNREHDVAIGRLLFVLSEWHSCAKMRIHTTSSVARLRELTREFGIRVRHFANHICPHYDTKELPKEEAARIRRRTAQSKGSGSAAQTNAPKAPPKRKTFQLTTYKLHAMGDYVSNIEMFGTTDSYSTQAGELEHRSVKRYYARTNKMNATRQMAHLHRRERVLRVALERRKQAHMTRKEHTRASNEDGHYKTINDHHFISHSRNMPLRIWSWLAKTHTADLRYKDFIKKLHDHLIGRFRFPNLADDGTQYEAGDHAEVSITNGRCFEHQTLQINYTSYDLQREYDIINPMKHADIMIPASDLDIDSGVSSSGHPFRYARVLGIFHADVAHVAPSQPLTSKTVEFLFVHWYRRIESHRAGFQSMRLHRLDLLCPEDNPDACGFLDPDDVIRGCHLIPTYQSVVPSVPSSGPNPPRGQVLYYSINCFVDRDMYNRYRGGGVGHVTLAVDNPPLAEIDPVILGSHDDEGAEGAAAGAAASSMAVESESGGGDGENETEIQDDDEEDGEEDDDDDDDEDEGEGEDEDMDEREGEGDNGDGLEESNDSQIITMMYDTLGYATL